MRLETSFERALYLWDYFYISNVPAKGEEKPWRLIENATCRIRESEQLMGPRYPPVIRLQNARRVRRAVRVILKRVQEIEHMPPRWVADVLAYFELAAAAVIGELKDADLTESIH